MTKQGTLTPMEPKLLILDGNQRASLAATRSLGSRGLWIAVGECRTNSLAGSSRYCCQRVVYPDPFESPRNFFDSVLQLVRELGITFLLPITEVTAYIILNYRGELPPEVTLPFADNASVELLANKNALFEMAAEQSVPIPETVFCNSKEDGLAALEGIHAFPVVLKPFKSKILQSDTILATHVIIASTLSEAREAIQAHAFFNFPFTLQSYIAGSGQGVFALFDHGKPVCYFAHRRIREKPPGGGVSVLSESAPINEQLKQMAEKLLQTANWHGVAMVEFRVSEDGTGYLMEVNTRFWGSLQLAVDSGVDFPWLLFQISTGQSVTVPGPWQHRRLRWLLGDLDRLYLVWKSPASTYPLGRKLIELLRFLTPGLHTRHEVNRWRDLRPFWLELKRYVRALRR